MTITMADDTLAKLNKTVERMVRETFPHVTFTNIWIIPRHSFYGDLMIDIWSIYDGELKQIHTPERRELRSRLRNVIHGHGFDASPSLRFVMKSEAGDWKPEGL